MKQLVLLIAVSFLTQVSILSQSCLPEGIVFTTQEQINNFQNNYPGCTEVEGFVRIQGDEISNLNGLNGLTSIGGMLRFYTCTALPNLTGLESLTTIGGDLDIYVWPSATTILTTISGLDNLVSVGGSVSITGSDVLTSLTGLENLITIGEDLSIAGNENLNDLSGLDNLTSIGDDLYIGENLSMINLTGLENLTSVGGYIDIAYNEALVSLIGIENIEAASISEYFYVRYNPLLSTCAVQSVCDYLAIPGVYVELLYNAPGCNSNAEVEDACEALSVNEYNLLSDIKIFPNPAINDIYIETEYGKDISQINIYNQIGQLVLKEKPFINTIDLTNFQAGIYIIELVSAKWIHREKLIIK